MKKRSENPRRQNLGLDLGLWHHQTWENALKQRGEGHSLGVPPLRAVGFSTGSNCGGAPVGMTDTKDPEIGQKFLVTAAAEALLSEAASLQGSFASLILG
jgi:hypothetical protein